MTEGEKCDRDRVERLFSRCRTVQQRIKDLRLHMEALRSSAGVSSGMGSSAGGGRAGLDGLLSGKMIGAGSLRLRRKKMIEWGRAIFMIVVLTVCMSGAFYAGVLWGRADVDDLRGSREAKCLKTQKRD